MRLAPLVVHLARVELRASHRFTLLGAAWPLARLLAQWAVLALVFTQVVDLRIHDYPVFLLCGLVVWAWFAAGVSAGAGSVLRRRHLALQPGVPTHAIPLVAVAVPLVDVVLAIPVLLIVLVTTTQELPPTLLLIPVLLAIEFVLIAGLAWLTAGLVVYLRDVANITDVGLLLLFYLTPVFYDLDRVPDAAADALALNPVGVLITAWRDVAAGELPDWGALGLTTLFAAAVALLGARVYGRLSHDFADEL